MLTILEYQTWRLLADGATQNECAVRLGCAQGTVSKRLSNLRRRFPGLDIALMLNREIAHAQKNGRNVSTLPPGDGLCLTPSASRPGR